jgi:hypothetical protein
MPAIYREPLCLLKVLPFAARFPTNLVRGHYPSFIAHTGSCARPKPSCCLGFNLAQQVFAGCCKSLLGDGLSRRYLRFPCIGAWTLTPPQLSGALTRFFPESIGLTLRSRSSACGFTPVMQLQQGKVYEAAVIPSCSGSYTC